MTVYHLFGVLNHLRWCLNDNANGGNEFYYAIKVKRSVNSYLWNDSDCNALGIILHRLRTGFLHQCGDPSTVLS